MSDFLRKLRGLVSRNWKFQSAASSSNTKIAPERAGWPSLPDTLQKRRRSTDARPWDKVR